jgi:sterol 3beta-glucosyltransferase
MLLLLICRCGVLLTGGWQPLADAYAALDPSSQQPLLFLQHQPLTCHHLLLAAADAVLHHGGSGTAAAALAAGTPQLICPLQFDQYYWVSWLCQLTCMPLYRNENLLGSSTLAYAVDLCPMR